MQTHEHDRPVEAVEEVEALRQQPVDQARAGHHQRDAHRPGDHRHGVEQEGQRAGGHDPAVPAEPVHDRDGVDEDVEGARARPQREDEADRDDVVAAARQHLVDRRLDDVVDRPVGQRLAGHLQHRVADVVELGGGELDADEADRPGQREDQRRHRQHGEERRLGRQAGHPVPEAGADRGDDDPPQVLAQLQETDPRWRSARGPARARRPWRHGIHWQADPRASPARVLRWAHD